MCLNMPKRKASLIRRSENLRKARKKEKKAEDLNKLQNEVSLTRLEIFNITKDVLQNDLNTQILILESAISNKIGSHYQIPENERSRLKSILSTMRIKRKKKLIHARRNEEWLNVVETFKKSTIQFDDSRRMSTDTEPSASDTKCGRPAEVTKSSYGTGELACSKQMSLRSSRASQVPIFLKKDPSTGSHLYSDNDIDAISVKSENVHDEDYDYSGSEVVDTNVMLDITDTQALLDDVEKLRVKVNPKYPTHKECDLFGEYVAKNLQQLPLEVASKLKLRIQSLMTETLLEYPPKAPPVVKLEIPADENVPIRTHNIETQTNQTISGERPQSCTAKIPQNTDSPVAKRLKLDNLCSETQISNSKNQPNRTEWTRFAENIALQLEQLPEEVSLQLQSDIYDLISHVLTNPADDPDSPNRVKIKEEIIEITPTEIVHYQS